MTDMGSRHEPSTSGAGVVEAVRLRSIQKYFGSNHVLQGVGLCVRRGEHVVVFGPSGSGKSTLLRTINLLEEPQSGSVVVEGREYGPGVPGEPKQRRGDRRELRKQVGMVFQQFNLFPHLSVLDNVTIALRRVKGMKRGEAELRAARQLDRVGLLSKIGSYPAMLSGGQQQRVAIARSLVMDSKLMLFTALRAGIFVFTVQYSAWLGAILRAGIQAVPGGQREAAPSVGMGRARTFFTIVIPQAVVELLPPRGRRGRQDPARLRSRCGSSSRRGGPTWSRRRSRHRRLPRRRGHRRHVLGRRRRRGRRPPPPARRGHVDRAAERAGPHQSDAGPGMLGARRARDLVRRRAGLSAPVADSTSAPRRTVHAGAGGMPGPRPPLRHP
jgi:ABC-type polar amino acid transport system ATPase subunit